MNEKHARTDEFEKATDSFLLFSRASFSKNSKQKKSALSSRSSSLQLYARASSSKKVTRASRRTPFVATVPNRARAREHFFCIDAISGLLLDRRYNRELEGKELIF